MRRRHALHALALLPLAVLVGVLACGDSPDASRSRASSPPKALAPVTSVRATLVLEPPKLKIGEVATAVVTVVTPPGYRLLPISPPEVGGVWLLDARALEVQRSEARWVHRSQIRIRARHVGPVVWPAFSVTVEDAAGGKRSIEVGDRLFEVVSVLDDFPDQTAPFGLRAPERSLDPGGFWVGAGVGAGVVFALVGVAFAFYRGRDRVPRESEAARRSAREREVTLWDWAESELGLAIDALDAANGPRDAASRGAKLLRQYVARRFNIETQARTTEELTAAKPPLAIDSRWPELLRILRRFDAERFRKVVTDESAKARTPGTDRTPAADGVPAVDRASAVDRVRGEIEAVKRFVDDSIPPELRR